MKPLLKQHSIDLVPYFFDIGKAWLLTELLHNCKEKVSIQLEVSAIKHDFLEITTIQTLKHLIIIQIKCYRCIWITKRFMNDVVLIILFFLDINLITNL